MEKVNSVYLENYIMSATGVEERTAGLWLALLFVADGLFWFMFLISSIAQLKSPRW